MEYYQLLPLLGALFCYLLAAFIFHADRRAAIHKIYALLALFVATYSFLQYGYASSTTYQEACFWWKLDLAYTMIPPLQLHFVLAFCQKEILKKYSKIILPILYAPWLFFLTMDVAFDLVTGPPVKKEWGGYTYGIKENAYSVASYLLFFLYTFVNLVFLGKNVVKSKGSKKLLQSIIVFVAFCIPFVTSILDYLWISTLDYTFMLTDVSIVVSMSVIAYGIWRYGLFALTPVTAAENIVTTMNDALFLIDPEGEIMSSNTAATALLGYNSTELKKRNITDIFKRESLLPISGDEIQKDTETTMSHQNGQEIPVSLSTSTLINEKKEPIGFVYIARDITERRKAQDAERLRKSELEKLVKERTSELFNANETLKKEIAERREIELEKSILEKQFHHAQKMEAIGRLAGGIAHDFNNLLLVINGYSDAVQETLEPGTDAHEDMQEIKLAASRAISLTKQLLTFSRKQAISPRILDLNNAIDKSKKMLARLIGENILLTFLPAAQPIKLKMDPSQFDQILANLTVNARDAMPDGGTITIATDKISVLEPLSCGDFSLPPGEYVQITFMDTGVGMSAEIQKKVFEPFFSTKGASGTGLGLATIYGIVKQNNGYITVGPNKQQGTRFDLYLPFEANAVPDAPEVVVQESKTSLKNITVLLVEDNHMVRQLTKRFLTQKGIGVIQAENAAEAVAALTRHEREIQLLLTDVVMPGMNGKQLAAKLVRMKPELKVLFMSGHNEEVMSKYGLLNDEVELIGKPFSASQLFDRIQKIII